MLEKEEEPFPFNVGRPTQIHLQAGSIIGVYRGTTDIGFAILLPNLITESFPNEPTKYRWEEGIPKSVKFGLIEGTSPVRQEYIERIFKANSEPTSNYSPPI